MTMNRIDKLFAQKKGNILSVFFTAGYPAFEDTLPILELLEKYGADMVEIGIPFSDPVADGPTIQQASSIALEQGMTLEKLLGQLANMRTKISIPVILMGYLNPILQFGIDKFLERCRETGIDGLIIPDFPPEEFEKGFAEKFLDNGISYIPLAAPSTSAQRFKLVDKASTGFIYVVSSPGVTGGEGQFSETTMSYFKKLGEAKPVRPMLVGFGIHNANTFEQACEYTSGAIVGSAFIRALEKGGSLEEKISGFMKKFR
ncbi:MAG: tryptophan synthase subunit alpha [Bacteroidota bacterium]